MSIHSGLIPPSPSGEGPGVGRFRERRACGDAPQKGEERDSGRPYVIPI